MGSLSLRRWLLLVGVLLAGFIVALLSLTPQKGVAQNGEPLSGDSLAVAASVAHLQGSMILAATPALTPPRTVASCMGCHGSTPKFPILGARMTYDHSGHKNNGNSAYANGGGCQQCHTNEGFIEYVTKGSVDAKAFVKYPSQPSCTTCHMPHESGDMRLRTVKPVELKNKVVFDSGNGNLCASCHMARSDATTMVKATAANTISGSWGAHHGPQSDMMMGTNAYQIPGKEYSSSDHASAVDDGCVTCHMSVPEGRYGFSPSLGGHSFNISADVHEAEKLNVSGCVSCHKDMTQVAGTSAWSKAGGAGVIWVEKPPVFSVMAQADYDQDGKKEVVQEEVQGLMDKMVNRDGTGLLQKSTPILYDAKGAYVGNKSTEMLPVEKVGALYNYKYVLEDRSRGVHNATYTIQLLYDSIALLDPKFNTALRPK